MKRLLLITVTIIMLIAFCGCADIHQNSYDNDTDIENTQEKTVEYYPNSSVPKLDSVLDENEIIGKTEYPLYGPYETASEGMLVIQSYVAVLETNYGFDVTDDSVGYTLSNGSDKVVVMGGNTQGKFAVAVVVN